MYFLLLQQDVTDSTHFMLCLVAFADFMLFQVMVSCSGLLTKKSWLSAQQASYSVVCACVVMLRLNTDNQWHDRGDHFSQKGLTRWQEAILCILSMATLGFLVGLCYRTGAPVAYAIALLVMMGLLTIPLLARQVCTSYYFVGFTSSSCFSSIPLCETLS